MFIYSNSQRVPAGLLLTSSFICTVLCAFAMGAGGGVAAGKNQGTSLMWGLACALPMCVSLTVSIVAKTSGMKYSHRMEPVVNRGETPP